MKFYKAYIFKHASQNVISFFSLISSCSFSYGMFQQLPILWPLMNPYDPVKGLHAISDWPLWDEDFNNGERDRRINTHSHAHAQRTVFHHTILSRGAGVKSTGFLFSSFGLYVIFINTYWTRIIKQNNLF